MPLTQPRLTYKPFEYPWAFEAYKTQQSLHWLPEEVPMAEDVRDWQTKMTPAEKNLAGNILKFFTTGDCMVADAYINHYMPYFKPTEIRMMMAAFAASEANHIHSYAHLNDTLGIPDSEYGAFLDHAEMKAKYDFLQTFNPESPLEVAKTIAAFSAGVEGTQLFSSFAMLMNFAQHNLLKGVGQIVSWSSREEHLHANSMIKLFNVFVEEFGINRAELKPHIVDVMETVVKLEDAFIDKAYELGPVKGLQPIDIKNYVRYIGGQRMEQLGYENIFGKIKNPLPWMDAMLALPEHANFFEQRVTEYTKGSLSGDWSEVF